MAENQNNNSRAKVPSGPGIIGPGVDTTITDVQYYRHNSPVKVGGVGIYPIYVGSKEVQSIYIGSKQIYGYYYETKTVRITGSEPNRDDGNGNYIYIKGVSFELPTTNCRPVYVYASTNGALTSISGSSTGNSSTISISTGSYFTGSQIGVTVLCYYAYR